METAPSLNSPVEIRRLLAERVRHLRVANAWTQHELAKRAGVSWPTVQRYEQSGDTSLKNLLRICHALGRLDEFEQLLRPPAAASLAELEARTARPVRKRVRR